MSTVSSREFARKWDTHQLGVVTLFSSKKQIAPQSVLVTMPVLEERGNKPALMFIILGVKDQTRVELCFLYVVN